MIELTYENGRIEASYKGKTITVEEMMGIADTDDIPSTERVGIYAPFSRFYQVCTIANDIEKKIRERARRRIRSN